MTRGPRAFGSTRKPQSGLRLAQFFSPIVVLFAAVVTVCLFAIAYRLLGSGPNGLTSSSYTAGPSWAQCLYFSVITFTTVGYGDWVPRGWAMLLASAEALIGLALFGVLVAHLASVRSSHLLWRIYSGDAQRRLGEMEKSLAATTDSLARALDSAGDEWSQDVEEEMGALWAITRGLLRYLEFENQHLDFFGEVPINASKKVLWKLEEALELGDRLVSVSRHDGRPASVFVGRFAEWADNCAAIADVVDAFSINTGLLSTAKTVRSAALRVRAGVDGHPAIQGSVDTASA